MENLNLIMLAVMVLLLIGMIILILLIMHQRKHGREQEEQQLKLVEAIMAERLTRLEKTVQSDIYRTQMQFGKDLRDDFDKLNVSIERKVLHLQNEVEEKFGSRAKKIK